MFSSQTHREIPQNNFRNPSLGPNNTIYGPSRGLRPVKSRKMDESEKKKAPTVPPRPPNPRDSRNAYSNYGREIVCFILMQGKDAIKCRRRLAWLKANLWQNIWISYVVKTMRFAIDNIRIIS